MTPRVFRSTKASRVFAALQRIGWTFKRKAKGSHKVLQREGYPTYIWSFHDRDEIGPKMLARISMHTGCGLRTSRVVARIHAMATFDPSRHGSRPPPFN